jgi:ubiquinone/menaquinone biosynthesis C-methylase UbiE
MNNPSFENIANFYNERVRTFGHDPRACDYGRAESQQRKFAVLSRMTDYSQASVLDVGCGFADFADYLFKRYQGVEYHGLDLSQEMITKARLARPRLDLRVGNVLKLPQDESYDIITANGIFYLLGEDAESLMQKIVAEMFKRSRKGVVFNSLSSWASIHEKGEYYANPLAVVEWCRKFSPWITLRHDYLLHDFTVYISKEPLGL